MKRYPTPMSKIPSKFLKPLQLSDAIAGSLKTRLTGICFNEISSLFLCLKNSGFNEEVCSKEVNSFQNCYNLHYHRKFSKQTGSGGKRVGPEDINKLLKRFPDVKKI